MSANDKDLEASVPLNTEKELNADDELKELERELGAPAALPSPTSARQNAQPIRLSASTIIPIWIVLSSTVIIYNNYLYNTLGFEFPVFLVTWHLAFAAIGTRILQRTTHLLDGAKDIHMTKDMFVRSILPIGVLFKPNRRLLAIVCMISGGVSLASYGELRFDMFGFVIQALAVCFEASRLVMIQVLLHGMKMDPLVSLHYYAPVCAIINLLVLPFTEGWAPFQHLYRIGPVILISNAAVAFLLNVAAVFLIGAGSGLVLTLAGVFKDILLISGSVLVFGAQITPLQVFGYSAALGGLVMFKTTGGK
ncbi:hypothetical protein FRB90_007078 [Tulasnella sp. 427]|nr:hypothetical protein FRB90_007078 [Tulasnella sp. 427]